jgi:hypothetical protein
MGNDQMKDQRIIVHAADVAVLVGFMNAPLTMPASATIADWLQDPGSQEACAAARRLQASLPVPFAEVRERLHAAVAPYMRVEEVTRDRGIVLARGYLPTPDAAALDAATAAAAAAGLPVWSALWDEQPRTKGEWAAWKAAGPRAPVAGPVTLQVLKETSAPLSG